MTKKIYILLMVTLSLLLGPTQTYAAVTSDMEMSCCTKEGGTKDCCKDKGEKEQKHNCDTSCVGTSCGCPTVFCGSTPIFFSHTATNVPFKLTEKEQEFYYSEIIISSDFRSIWLPPKLA